MRHHTWDEARDEISDPVALWHCSSRLNSLARFRTETVLLLEIQKLRKSFLRPGGGLHPVIDVAEFHFGAGEELALAGESGSGKSTFLNLVAGLILGLTRPSAAKFSFLAALPITLGAVLVKIGDLKTAESWEPLLWGILSAMIVGMIAIKVLLKYVQNHSYLVFAIYRWLVAAGIIGLFFAKGMWKL